MIYIIDGTGSSDNGEYDTDMSRGFCYNINQQINDSKYFRGPTDLGLTTWDIADKMLEIILSDRKSNPNSSICLVGHSRGGAACIDIAHSLNKNHIKVNSMLLFDAVDRAIGGNTDSIPSNVGRCLHLMRDEKFSNYFINLREFKSLLEKVPSVFRCSDTSYPMFRNELIGLNYKEIKRYKELFKYHRALRDACRFDVSGTGFSFGNAGKKADAPCKFKSRLFEATHGAMGGAPLEVGKYIHDIQYAKEIERYEVDSILKIQSVSNSFLREVGESGGGSFNLDYIPASTMYDQTAIKIKT